MEKQENKDWDGVIREGKAIRDLYPDYVEDHSVYEALAAAYIAKKDDKAAIAPLQRKAERAGGRLPGGCSNLLFAGRNWKRQDAAWKRRTR